MTTQRERKRWAANGFTLHAASTLCRGLGEEELARRLEELANEVAYGRLVPDTDLMLD